jgi:hypothetical protein
VVSLFILWVFFGIKEQNMAMVYISEMYRREGKENAQGQI